ncbi:hypothetical protein [Luteococcus sp. OSA5]|uniref:hypothetical protein n=1 Tax=Luteococcus sp. OSA5 TaxID=3401630 RepID=UPI003B4383B2
MIETGRLDPAEGPDDKPRLPAPGLLKARGVPESMIDDVSRPPAVQHNRTVVALALAALTLFGVSTSLLGLGVLRMTRPCRMGCAPDSTESIARWVLLVAPAAVSVLAALATLRRAHWRRPRPWLPAVLGCLAGVLCVYVGSVLLGVA